MRHEPDDTGAGVPHRRTGGKGDRQNRNHTEPDASIHSFESLAHSAGARQATPPGVRTPMCCFIWATPHTLRATSTDNQQPTTDNGQRTTGN